MVIAQFPIPENILKENDPLKGFDYVRERVRYASKMKERKSFDTSHIRIKDLRAGMKRINLKARVIKISKPKLVLTRFNDYVVFANATLADETSTIKLTLWNGRINMISINDIVQIENANVIVFRGEKQLRIGRNGKLKVVENSPLHEPKPTVRCVAK
jgi:ssDNA-binding replication factor A large subunit